MAITNKKILLILATGLFISLFIFSACNSDMDEVLDETTINIKQNEILNQLQAYNDNFIPTPTSRSIGRTGWLRVVIADGKGAYEGAKLGCKVGRWFGPKGATIGAILGGVVVGGGSSCRQYRRESQEISSRLCSAPVLPIETHRTFAACYAETKELIQPSDYTLGISLGLDSTSVKIAIQHNMVLDRVEAKELTNPQIIIGLTETEEKIVNSDEFKITSNEIISEPLSPRYDYDSYSDNIMNLFINLVSTNCRNQDDLNRIVSNYTSTVQNPYYFTTEETESLCAGFAVMAYSQYWSEKWPTIDPE